MLTRQGVAVLVAGGLSLIVGRAFGVVELFVIGAGCFAAVIVAVTYVGLRRPRLDADRWIHPSVLVAGDAGRVDLRLHHLGRHRSAPFALEETVHRAQADDHVARLPVGALGGDGRAASGYHVPTATRGVILLGPLRAVIRDPLGLAMSSSLLVDVDEVVVAPRTLALDMPKLGQGQLGSVLMESARRLGPGDFHGLREYATGDEPRSIHWKASARTDALMVKEYTVEGLHHCTVVFDALPGAYADSASFERGVTAAASLVDSAMRAGLTTRFVTARGVDLRGPDVVTNTLRVLARLEPSHSPLASLEADVIDGLGMVIVVTGTHLAGIWNLARSMSDPTMTRLIVTTDERASAPLAVPARSDDEFVSSWQALVGRGRVDLAGHR